MKNIHVKSKMLGVLISTCMIFSGGVFAKPPGGKPDFDYLAYKLELTDAQRESFIRLMESQHEKLKELREQAREQKKESFEMHKEETLAQLSDVLTAQQLATFESMMKEHRARREKDRKDNHSQP